MFCPESIQYVLIESSVAEIRELSHHGHFINDILANYVLGEGARQVRGGHSKFNGAKGKAKAEPIKFIFGCFSALSIVRRLDS